MAKKASTIVRLRLLELRTDPHQYKPFAPALAPESDDKPIYVDFEVPTGAKVDKGGVVVLNAAGFQGLLKAVAGTILKVHVTERD